MRVEFDVVEVSKQRALADLVPDEDDASEQQSKTEEEKTRSAVKDEAKLTESSNETKPLASNAAPADDFVSSSLLFPSDPSSLSLAMPLSLTPSSSDLLSLSVPGEYDDEVSAELWLAQRQYALQSNHNNYTRSYLEVRARVAGDWKVSIDQLDQKQKQEEDTLALYEEMSLLSMARALRLTRRMRFEQSEAGQIRNIKKWEKTQQRNQRHIQRLLKQMVGEVEKREKKRLATERRSKSAAAREAKRQRRQALEAQWKSKKEADIFRRCENAMEHMIRAIEREVEGKKRYYKKKQPGEEGAEGEKKKRKRGKKKTGDGEDPNALYCICRTPYDNDRFYLGCEACNGWFHGKCVHISEEQAAEIDEFICPDCEKKTGRITTYLDPKRERARRREKLQAEAEESSEEESEAESEEEEEEEEDRLMLVIRREKKRGKMQYSLVDDSKPIMLSDVEEEEEEEEESEEEEEEFDSVIRLQRANSHILRLRRLPDAPMPEIKTRKQINLSRFEYSRTAAWSALFDPRAPESHEQSARRLVRRFRFTPNFYPTLLTAPIVSHHKVTPSVLPVKHKFSAYAYRDTQFRIVCMDREHGSITIRKTENGRAPRSRALPPSPSKLQQSGAAAAASPAKPPATPKPQAKSAAALKTVPETEQQPSSAAAAVEPGLASPSAPSASTNQKRKREADAVAAIKTLAAVATAAQGDEGEESAQGAEDADRPAKRTRRSPVTPSPSTPVPASSPSLASPRPSSAGAAPEDGYMSDDEAGPLTTGGDVPVSAPAPASGSGAERRLRSTPSPSPSPAPTRPLPLRARGRATSSPSPDAQLAAAASSASASTTAAAATPSHKRKRTADAEGSAAGANENGDASLTAASMPPPSSKKQRLRSGDASLSPSSSTAPPSALPTGLNRQPPQKFAP